MVYNVTCSHGAGPCLRKPAQYIGKVGPTRACRVRCTEHRRAVNHQWDTGVGEHFNLPGHDLANFNFRLKKSEAATPLSSRHEKATGLRNTKFWAKVE